MTTLRVNAPVEQAKPLLERFAQIGVEVELTETSRSEAIAAANLAADNVLLRIMKERDALRAVLEPWWKRMGSALLTGKRKSIELGGCMIGTKAATASLSFEGGDFDAAVALLREQRWAKPYVRVTYAVDKKAAKAALDGKHGEQLRELGFGTAGGGEVFVLEPVKQAGTVAG